MKRWSVLLLFLLVQSTAGFCEKEPKLPVQLPDLPFGATFFFENASTQWSPEAKRFGQELQSVVSRTDRKRNRIRPGLMLVNNKAAAAYVLRYVVVAGAREPGCNALSCLYTFTQGNFRATILLLGPDGTKLWRGEYECFERIGGLSAEVCADRLANDLKAAQVDDDHQRAGSHGWKQEDAGPFQGSPRF